MVFAVNCGADGTPNSFTNFKNSALQIGASLSAAAGSATAPYGAPYGAATPPSGVATAAYGGVTIPPAVRISPSVILNVFCSFLGYIANSFSRHSSHHNGIVNMDNCLLVIP